MSHRARAPLAELKEVEDRLAVRAARIDQLQAAVEASHERTLRFSRVLIVVAGIAALATSMFDLRQSNQLDYLLVLAATVSILVAILFTLALRRLVRRRDEHESAGERILARWVWRDLTWQAKPVNESSGRMARSLFLVSAPLVLVAPVILAVMGEWVESIALAAIALLLSVGLLRGVWSRQISAPGTVRLIAPLIAVAATFSLGSWAGGRGADLLRIEPWVAEHHTQAVDGRPRLMSLPAGDIPTYSSLCGQREPWPARPQSAAMARLREAWFTVGAVTAGCPTLVRKAIPGGGFIAAIGIADGRINSVGVADRNHSVLLFGEAAVVAKRLLQRGDLLDVPIHDSVEGGDIYLLDTRQGTIAVTRQAAPEAGRERQFEDLDSPPRDPFAVLSPELTSLWTEAMLENNGWLWPSPSGPESRRFVFFAGDIAVARAWCNPAAGECELTTNSGWHLEAAGPRWVNPAEVLAFASSP